MAARSEDTKLIILVITFELVQPICPGYINVTDRQTDGRTTYDSNIALALRASRGKNPITCQLLVQNPGSNHMIDAGRGLVNREVYIALLTVMAAIW